MSAAPPPEVRRGRVCLQEPDLVPLGRPSRAGLALPDAPVRAWLTMLNQPPVRTKVRSTLALLAALGLVSPVAAQSDSASRSWNQPVRPFRIAGNIYYVGASDVTSFLITTPRGHVLVDGGFAETPPLILASIRALGFWPEDVRLIVASHAHYDHAGGLAELKRVTGATLVAGAGDSALLRRGGLGDPNFGDRFPFPAVTPDRLVHDGDTVSLGGMTLVARVTPGHTRGCTTWTTTVRERGREYGAVFICSASVPGYQLVGNQNYPNIVADYRRTFGILRSLRCDVFLAAHGVFFSLKEKIRQREAEPESSPFIDPEGCRAHIDRAERTFETRLREQAAAAAGRGSSRTAAKPFDRHRMRRQHRS